MDKRPAAAKGNGLHTGSMMHFGVTDVIRGWQGRMKHIRRDLDTVTDHTEEEFLSIGSVLRDFHSRARKVSEQSSAIAAQMTGGEIVQAIDGLNGLLERMEESLRLSEAETEKRIESLRGILRLLEGIYAPLEDFHRITKTLRSLNITARVQNASLMTHNRELKVLLDEVKKLSGVMTAKSERIGKDLKLLEYTIQQTLSQFLFFKEKQQGRARAILDGTMSVICSITEQYGLSAAVARDISAHFSDISGSIAEIVISVQFHDITRQHFERVKNALEYVQEGLLPLSEERSFRLASGPVAEMAAGIEKSCKQHAAELYSIRDTFVTAVRGITDHLRLIAEKVTAISGDARKIVGHEGSTKGTFLAVMEGMLSSVTESFAALSESAAAGSELSDAVQSLTGITAEIAEFIGEIEGIAEDIELIAFNTEIKSSHMGKEGATFEIVAAGIQKLSVETCTRVGGVSEILRFVASAASGLAPENQTGGGNALDEVEAISGDLEQVISALSEINRKIISLFEEIERAGRALSGDIESMAGSMNVHSVVDKVVERAVAELKETVSHARLMLPMGNRGEGKKTGEGRQEHLAWSSQDGAEIIEGDGVEFF